MFVHVINFTAQIGQGNGEAHACSRAAVITPQSSSIGRSNTIVLAEEQGLLIAHVISLEGLTSAPAYLWLP